MDAEETVEGGVGVCGRVQRYLVTFSSSKLGTMFRDLDSTANVAEASQSIQMISLAATEVQNLGTARQSGESASSHFAARDKGADLRDQRDELAGVAVLVAAPFLKARIELHKILLVQVQLHEDITARRTLPDHERLVR